MVADVVIVGAGTAGCAAAATLLKEGRSVVLIEAGPDYGSGTHGWPADLLDAASLPTSHDWGFHGLGAGGQDLRLDRARVMGGCSSHNGCTQSVGWAGDYDEWSGEGWSADELAPLFEQTASAMSFQHYDESDIQPFQRSFLDACSALGLPQVDDFDDLNGLAGAGCPPVNALDGVRMNTSFAFLDPVRGHPGLTLIDRATVIRVVLDGTRASHVEYVRGESTVTVSASEVLLCAGAYGTPAILQRSGIGDPRHLESIGVRPLVHAPGVGQNLHDHPASQLLFSSTPTLDEQLAAFERTRWLPEEQAVAKIRSPDAVGPYDLHVYPWVERKPHGEGWLCVFPVGLLTPRSRGSVTIRSESVDDHPLIETGFFSDAAKADIAAMRYGVRWVLDLVRQEGLAALIRPSEDGPTPRMTDHQLDEWIRRTHAHYWHPAGTCMMGSPGDPRAVVDFSGRVLGVEGLRVADASIFPCIPRSTPAWPTTVVGVRMAQFLVGSSAAA